MTFKFGDTYKRKADDCIDEFLTNRENYNGKMSELNNQTAALPRLTAISYDPEVRDRLNMYRDTHPLQPILMGTFTLLTYGSVVLCGGRLVSYRPFPQGILHLAQGYKVCVCAWVCAWVRASE
jgi:hypothetical protein